MLAPYRGVKADELAPPSPVPSSSPGSTVPLTSVFEPRRAKSMSKAGGAVPDHCAVTHREAAEDGGASAPRTWATRST